MIPGAVNVVVWAVAAVACVCLAWTHGRGKNAAWIVMALYCFAVAIDKHIDIQIPIYNAVRDVYQALDGVLPMGTDNNVMRVLTVGAAFLAGVITTLVFIRRDKSMSGPKWLALGGLLLIVGYVCLRWVPGIRGTDVARIDGVVELVGLLMVIGGLLWDSKRLVTRVNE